MAGYDGLGREELAILVREYLLAGHMIDRAAMPHIIGGHGREPMQAIAIDEWMGASPIYTRRLQQLLGYAGTDVATSSRASSSTSGAHRSSWTSGSRWTTPTTASSGWRTAAR